MAGVGAKLVSVELRNAATSVSLDIPKIDVEKLKMECGFFGSNYPDICITGSVTLDVPASCTRDSMKAFAVILSRLCDDDDLKRKSTRVVDVELPNHVRSKMVEVIAKHDISVFMGVIRITQNVEHRQTRASRATLCDGRLVVQKWYDPERRKYLLYCAELSQG
jgi:hypothetical protein